MEIDGLILQKRTNWFDDFKGIKEACIDILKKTRPYVDSTDEEVMAYISGIKTIRDNPFEDMDTPQIEEVVEESEPEERVYEDVFDF